MANQLERLTSIKVFLGILIITIFICIVWIIIQYRLDMKAAYGRLDSYDTRTINTEYGTMSYVEDGEGEAILLSHGIFGGYDQGYVSLKQLVKDDYRKIAISRFGYPGSDLPLEPTPKNQAKVYKELLEQLSIDKAYILATSAGGASALRFALDYPEKVKGLILLSSGVPDKKRTEKEIKELGMMGPPKVIVNDFPMWFSMKYFGFIFDSMMGSDVSKTDLFDTMLPVSPRRDGILIDTEITNIDMTLHYEEYPVENIKAPILVLHAKDDPMAKYENIEKMLTRINAKTTILETGGHTIEGNGGQVEKAILNFIEDTK
jgi:pimeloyl-ACP methyl ester carboxylesterase